METSIIQCVDCKDRFDLCRGDKTQMHTYPSQSCTEEIPRLSEITLTCFHAGGALNGILKVLLWTTASGQ